MLINSENIIDLDCFSINPSVSIQEIDLGCTKVYTMDNFYEKFEHAHEEMLKLPFCPVHKSDNITHFDGRSSYAYSMTMTQCPLTTHYKHLVAQLAEVSVERVECKDRILFNAFQFTTDWFDYQNNWYNIHNDASYSDSSNMISMVVFMNKHYEEGEGINVYDYQNRDKYEFMEPKENFPPLFTLQAKPNRAILFNGHMPHGPCIGTDQFTKETRYTQVAFSTIQ